MQDYDNLKLESQICFPLYICSKEIIKKYKPFLDKIDLTYTQYITMLVLWENDKINVKSLGKKLFLDSGTLTPVLQKLEDKGFIKKEKNLSDERNLIISITNAGKKLKEKAKDIPSQISNCINIESKDATILYRILYKILGSISDE